MIVKELIEKLKEHDPDYFVQIRKPNGNSYREIKHVRKALNRRGNFNIVIIEYWKPIK